MAVRSHAQWIVAYVETPKSGELSPADRNRVYETLRLAERLGAETVTITGDDVARALIRYALQRNATRIVVGKPGRAPWRDRIFGSMVDGLIRNEAGIDVTIIRGQLEETGRVARSRWRRPGRWTGYLESLAVVVLCSLIAWPLSHWFGSAGVAMLYLLGVALVAMWWGIGPSLVASVLGVISFDFFFTPPVFSLELRDSFLIFTFLVMVVVGNVIGSLALRIKSQAAVARRHEQRVTAMYQLTRDLTDADTVESMVDRVVRNITASFEGEAMVLLPDEERRVASPALSGGDPAVAQWVLEHGSMAGLGTDVLPSTDLLFLPLKADRGVVGVLGVRPRDKNLPHNPEQMLLLETLCRHAALAIEHSELVRETHDARMSAEAERLQNILLSSVSHDLRTPLASITGAASSLLDRGNKLEAARQFELLATIHDEADRLNRLVTNLLHVTRLESGALKPNKDWQSVEELVGAALNRLEKSLQDRAVNLAIPSELPLVSVDGILIEQVLYNLLDNAIKYTPPRSPIDIAAGEDGDRLTIMIADRGPGFAPGESERVFEKFFQGGRANAAKGSGLGLTVCRGFVEAHGGALRAFNREGGGAVFEIALPTGGKSPKIDFELSEKNNNAD
jgi:two-component system sensor histidine kinase KdpD